VPQWSVKGVGKERLRGEKKKKKRLLFLKKFRTTKGVRLKKEEGKKRTGPARIKHKASWEVGTVANVRTQRPALGGRERNDPKRGRQPTHFNPLSRRGPGEASLAVAKF